MKSVMNEFERLISLIKEGLELDINYINGIPEITVNTEEFADFLFDNGVILLPVKIGDTVYRLYKSSHTQQWSIKETKVTRIAIDQTEVKVSCERVSFPARFGELIFLTKEEAENALREKRFGR